MKRSIEEDGERQNCPTLNFPKSHKYLQNHLIARNIYSTLAELTWNFQSYFSIYLKEKIKA